MPARMVPSAKVLLLLLVAHFAVCMEPRKEDMEVCIKEAVDSSAVGEEDKTKALEIMEQAKRDMHRMHRERNKEALKEMRHKDFLSGKLQASEDIKDKQAAVKFIMALSRCLTARFISWENIHCQKAKDVNQDRLTDDDLKKLVITAKDGRDANGRQDNRRRTRKEVCGGPQERRKS
ncbi:hypothetical protein MRX96_022852 [Rhipicephalus microplus]